MKRLKTTTWTEHHVNYFKESKLDQKIFCLTDDEQEIIIKFIFSADDVFSKGSSSSMLHEGV